MLTLVVAPILEAVGLAAVPRGLYLKRGGNSKNKNINSVRNIVVSGDSFK